jgi:hypothetical protein
MLSDREAEAEDGEADADAEREAEIEAERDSEREAEREADGSIVEADCEALGESGPEDMSSQRIFEYGALSIQL